LKDGNRVLHFTGRNFLRGCECEGDAGAFLKREGRWGVLMDNVGKDEETTMDEFWFVKAGMITGKNRGFRLLIAE